MKLKILNKEGTEKGSQEMPVQFSESVRADIIKRAVLSLRSIKRQKYGAYPEAGKRASALLSKRRRKYRGMYGRGISRTPRVFLDLLTVKFLLTSLKGPMQIFGNFGLICLFLGFLSGIATIIMKIAKGIDMTGNPLLYLAVFLVIASLQFFSIGLLG